MLQEFNHTKVLVAGCEIDVRIAGQGNPILLLHGFPENKLAWHKIAPELISTHAVIVPDLPGYGDSTAPIPGDEYINCSKRAMAAALVEMMHQLGFDHFAVVGHDRGGRVAYRMALDYPQQVSALAVLNIIPTLDVIENFDYPTALQYENWLFLAQPAPFPETMLEKNADYYLQHILDAWSENPTSISPEVKADYLRCFRKKDVITAICNEYRATIWDMEYDRADRTDNKSIQCPVLVLWSKNGLTSVHDPLEIWKKYATNISGGALSGGHFLMEESPHEVMEQFRQFFKIDMAIDV